MLPAPVTRAPRAAPPVSAATISRFQGELRRYIARRVRGPDADDVLQETLLRIHTGLGALRSDERLAPWVYRVARNAIIDHQRRVRARPTARVEAEDALDALDTIAPGPAPDDDTPADDIREALSACVVPFLDSLPPEQAEALRLTELGPLTQAQAAAQLGVPLPTVKARVQRGRRRLRDVFDQCCAFEQDGRGAVIGAESRRGCRGE